MTVKTATPITADTIVNVDVYSAGNGDLLIPSFFPEPIRAGEVAVSIEFTLRQGDCANIVVTERNDDTLDVSYYGYDTNEDAYVTSKEVYIMTPTTYTASDGEEVVISAPDTWDGGGIALGNAQWVTGDDTDYSCTAMHWNGWYIPWDTEADITEYVDVQTGLPVIGSQWVRLGAGSILTILPNMI